MDALIFALALLCPGHARLAEPMYAAATRWGVDPVLVAQVVHSESRCKANAVNARTNSIGLGQIKVGGSAARGKTAAQLFHVRTNLDLTARHLAWCLALCGTPGAAIGVYHGRRKCRADAHSRKVLNSIHEAQRKAKS